MASIEVEPMNQPDQEFALRPTELNETFSSVAAPAIDESEFLRVEVSRKQYATLYLKVPKGWRPKGKDRKILEEAAKETVDNYDWDDFGWEFTIEMESWKTCDEREATSYSFFTIK